MSEVLRDIPVEGKVVGLKEDTVCGSFGRRELRSTLIIKNEIFGVNQQVAFVRLGEKGDILTALINDFKAGKELGIKGRISYSLYVSGGFFASRENKKFFKNVKHLKDKTAWQQLSEDDKQALKRFIGAIIAPYWGELALEVSVENQVKYLIFADDSDVEGASLRFYLPKEGGDE